MVDTPVTDRLIDAQRAESLPVPQRLQHTLRQWTQWSVELECEPQLQSTLNSGLSHQTYLVGSAERRFAVRIENHQSRALAMTKDQEITLMATAGDLAPQIVWADEFSLVTEYIPGAPWQPLRNLDALCQALHQLHNQSLDLPRFDLLQHCDHYWDKVLQTAAQPLLPDTPLFARARHKLVDVLNHHPDQCLCHNDLNPDNILCRDTAFYFLDWEYACYNSPYFELASIAELFQLSENQTLQLSNAYWSNSSRKTLALKSDTAHQNSLQSFRFVVRFTEWLWLTLKQPDQVYECEKRLRHLLTTLENQQNSCT